MSGNQRNETSLPVIYFTAGENVTSKEFSLRCLGLHFGGGHVLSISKTAEGKPVIEGRSDIHLSLSHSGKGIALLISPVSAGIDIEDISISRNFMAIAERFFHSDEVSYLKGISGEERMLQFLRLWTIKESIVKAIGNVDGNALHEILVPKGCFEEWHFLCFKGTAWHFQTILHLDGYVCTTAFPGSQYDYVLLPSGTGARRQ